MFYDRFRELAKQRGVSVTRACEEIGLSKSTATKWKNTGSQPSGDTLRKIADYFEVSADSLLYGDRDAARENAEKDGGNYIIINGRDGTQLRQHVSDEEYAVFKRMLSGLSSSNDSGI